jgi:hypothetical protein
METKLEKPPASTIGFDTKTSKIKKGTLLTQEFLNSTNYTGSNSRILVKHLGEIWKESTR